MPFLKVRPSLTWLSKKVFPVRRVTPKKASREVGIFIFSVFHFSLTRMNWEDWEKKLFECFFSKIMKKKFHPALCSPPGRWTGNHFLFKGGLNMPLEDTPAPCQEPHIRFFKVIYFKSIYILTITSTHQFAVGEPHEGGVTPNLVLLTHLAVLRAVNLRGEKVGSLTNHHTYHHSDNKV